MDLVLRQEQNLAHEEIFTLSLPTDAVYHMYFLQVIISQGYTMHLLYYLQQNRMLLLGE